MSVELISVAMACVVALAAMFQKTDERMYVGFVFSSLGLLHFLAFYSWQMADGERMDGVTYFVTAALTSLFAMELMARQIKIVELTITLQRICLIEIIANIAGLLLWYVGMFPMANVLVFMALRTWAIFALMQKDGQNDSGGFAVTGRWDYFMLIVNPRRSFVARSENPK